MTKETLKKFIEFYKIEYGIELTEAEAVVMATIFLKTYGSLYGNPYDMPNEEELPIIKF